VLLKPQLPQWPLTLTQYNTQVGWRGHLSAASLNGGGPRWTTCKSRRMRRISYPLERPAIGLQGDQAAALFRTSRSNRSGSFSRRSGVTWLSLSRRQAVATPTLIQVSAPNPVADGLGAGLKLPRQPFGERPAGTNERLSPTLRRVWRIWSWPHGLLPHTGPVSTLTGSRPGSRLHTLRFAVLSPSEPIKERLNLTAISCISFSTTPIAASAAREGTPLKSSTETGLAPPSHL